MEMRPAACRGLLSVVHSHVFLSQGPEAAPSHRPSPRSYKYPLFKGRVFVSGGLGTLSLLLLTLQFKGFGDGPCHIWACKVSKCQLLPIVGCMSHR